MTFIYLDNAATTLVDPDVIKRITEIMGLGPANPSSLHSCGQLARNHVDTATESIGNCLNTQLGEAGGARLIFTGSGTEANNLALRGLPNSSRLILSKIEHPSVIGVAQWLEQNGGQVDWINVSRSGVVDIEHLASILDSRDLTDNLVSVMWANNETGVLQPINEIAKLCDEQNAKLHVDATQCVGKIPIDLANISITSMSFSAHKFHGPTGIGAVWLAAGETIEPIMFGGEQQLESRPGTEPVALIAGMAEALRIATDTLRKNEEHCFTLRNRLENALLSDFSELVVHGQSVDRLPGSTCISFPGADRQSLLMALDFESIACSSGSTCSSGSSPPSHVLKAMQCSDSEINSSLRFAVSKFSKTEEIDVAIDRISSVYRRLRR